MERNIWVYYLKIVKMGTEMVTGKQNLRYNIVEYIKKNREISIDKINEICDFLLQIDEEYLSQ